MSQFLNEVEEIILEADYYLEALYEDGYIDNDDIYMIEESWDLNDYVDFVDYMEEEIKFRPKDYKVPLKLKYKHLQNEPNDGTRNFKYMLAKRRSNLMKDRAREISRGRGFIQNRLRNM